MAIRGLHHVQMACPPGSEDVLRDFYRRTVGLRELAKPAALASRGGVWFAVGEQQLHCGVQEDFAPARKAHPCFALSDVEALEALAERLAARGAPVRWDALIPGIRRFHTEDPVGNRVEFQATA